MEEDWDLHAVVRGCYNSTTTNTNTVDTTPITTTTTSCSDFSWFPPLDLQLDHHGIFSFPDLFNSRTTLEDLDQLCKPFLPPPSPVNLSSIPISSSSIHPIQHQQLKSEQQQPQQQRLQLQQVQQQQQQQQQQIQLPRRSLTSHTPTPRPKRRKNQQKRIVCQVPAEGLSSDMWAWRKYGQKPIKGSPYPRGYYRCSSSKGCLARKQVERSRSDPSSFIITYTAEHNHPVPTHRNSLAGSTRNKVSTSQRATTSDGNNTTTTVTTPTTPINHQPCSSFSPTTGLSPTTPLSIEEDLLQQSKQDEEDEVEGEEEDELSFPDELMDDDFFMDLEELARPTTTGPGQLPANFPWITAAGGS